MLPQTFFGVDPNPECECPPRIVSYEGTPTNGQILVYNSTTDTWDPASPNPGDITAVNTTLPLTGGGSSGAVTLDINNFTGDSGAGGLDGAVPAPAAGDAAAGKFLKADGTWAVPAGGGVALTRVSASSAVTGLTSTVFAPISFNTEDIDQNGAWVIGSPSQFTIPANGNYRVQFSAYAQIDAGASVSFQLEIQRSSNTEVASTYLSSADLVAYKWLTATLVRNFTAGDVIQMGYLFASGDPARSVRLFAGAFATLERLS